MRTTSQHGLRLLKSFEGGPHLQAYLCPARAWTISYGVTRWPTGEAVSEGDCVTPDMAEQLFADTLRRFEAGVSDLVTVELNQHQFDALACYAYNVGLGLLARTRALRNVNARRWEDAAAELADTVYMTVSREGKPYKKASRGLYRRHAAEGLLFLGLEWERAASEDNIALAAVPEYDPDRGVFRDRVTYRTPWSEIVSRAEGIAPIVPVEPSRPTLPPAPEPAPVPKPVVKAPETKPEKQELPPPKDMVLSRRFWGLFIFLLGRFTIVGTAFGATLQTVAKYIYQEPEMFAAASFLMVALSAWLVERMGKALQWWGRKRATRLLT